MFFLSHRSIQIKGRFHVWSTSETTRSHLHIGHLAGQHWTILPTPRDFVMKVTTHASCVSTWTKMAKGKHPNLATLALHKTQCASISWAHRHRQGYEMSRRPGLKWCGSMSRPQRCFEVAREHEPAAHRERCDGDSCHTRQPCQYLNQSANRRTSKVCSACITHSGFIMPAEP